MRRLYYSDDDFGQHFREALGNYREVPPRGNWKKINARLDKRVIRRYTGWIGGMAAMLTVVVLGVSINISTRNARLQYDALKQQAVKYQLESQKSIQPNKIQPSSTKPFEQTFANTNVNAIANTGNALVEKNSNVEAAQRSIELQSHVEQALNVVGNALSRNSNEIVFPVTPIYANAVESFNINDLILTRVVEEEFVSVNDLKTLDQSCYNFYVGLALQPQHNMFYSESAIHDHRMTYKFSPGYALGFTAGYNVLSKLAVETGGMWSVENQNYEFAKTQSKNPATASTTTNSNETKVGLTYVRVPLMLKYKMRWSGYETTCSNSINVLGGVQYGRFFGGTSEAQKKYELTNEEIKKNDLQVMLGAERSQRVAQNFTLNYGLRFGYAVSHMASGQSQRINTLYKPHNMLAAVNLSLNLHK